MPLAEKSGTECKPQDKSSPKSGFLNSFLSFIGENDSEKNSPISSVLKPILPKYIPEVKSVQSRDLPAKSPAAIDLAVSLTNSSQNGRMPPSGVCKGHSSFEAPKSLPLSVKSTQSSHLNYMLQTSEDVSSDHLPSSECDETSSVTEHMTSTSDSVGLKRAPLGHSKRKRGKQKYDSDDEQSVASSSSLEVQSKTSNVVAPARKQSSRKAKEKVQQRRIANIKKGKQLLSIYANTSDSSDSADEFEASAQTSENDREDSDSDPAWMPSTHTPTKRSHESDINEPLVKRRQRQQATPTQSTPSQQTAEKALNTNASSQSKTDSAQDAITDAVVLPKPAVLRGPKPAVRRPYERFVPLHNGPPEEDSPHIFQRGEFVIDRRDLTNYKTFPIWKIDSGRLLQKYEPVEKDGKHYHRPLSTYSSWTDQIHFGYKAIETSIISAIRGQELVEVIDKYWPRPSGEISYNEDSIKEAFNVYVQILVSQSLEATFLSALYQKPDKYYTDPLNTIDGTISKCLLKISNAVHWKDEFLKSINQLSSYKVEDFAGSGFCQAVSNKICYAEKLVKFYGSKYHRDNLQVTEEVQEDDSQAYEIGADLITVLPVYHGLQHFKMNLFKKCQTKIIEVKMNFESDVAEHELLDKCLNNYFWIAEMLESLMELIRSACAWKLS